MPTGYTAKIDRGASFNEFALGCARAFGACLHQRDEAGLKPPREMEADTSYHDDKIVEEINELKALKSLTDEQATAKAIEEVKVGREAHVECLSGNSELRKKYYDMMGQVDAWTPPTEEHHELKEFMLKQIRESIQWDCGHASEREDVDPLPGPEWRANSISKLDASIDYHREERDKKISRMETSNKWISDLYKSLKKDGNS